MGAISQEIMDVLREKLPDFFPRSRVEELTNGLLSSDWLYNLARMGKGPRIHRMGRQVWYMRDEFVDWLISHYRGMSDDYSRIGTAVHPSQSKTHGAGASGRRDKERRGSGAEASDTD